MNKLFNRLVLNFSVIICKSVRICVCALCVQSLWRPEGGDGAPEVVVTLQRVVSPQVGAGTTVVLCKMLSHLSSPMLLLLKTKTKLAFIYLFVFLCVHGKVQRQRVAVFSFHHVESNTVIRPQGQAPVPAEPSILLNWLLVATWNWAASCSIQQNELSFP